MGATSTNFSVRCTKDLPISSIALDATNVTDAATGLAYTLALADVPNLGSGVTQTVTLNGSMAGGQAGTCGSASCSNSTSTNKQRTLTITY